LDSIDKTTKDVTAGGVCETVPAQREICELDLDAKDKLNLHLQEYAALRAEQRTRLDSANKIIHYSAVVLAAVVVGLLSLYKTAEHAVFMGTFRVVLLLVPVVILPFAFTQQNEEIFVRHIGNYLNELKNKITSNQDPCYWTWETFHAEKQPRVLIVTGFFRASLLIIFSVLAQVSYYGFFGLPSSPQAWFQRLQSLSMLERTLGGLQSLDLVLNLLAIVVGMMMFLTTPKIGLFHRPRKGP
jgi:hypothetical protein